MKLNKIPKNELELLSYTEIAKMYLIEKKTTKTTAELFKSICDLLGLSESDYVDKIADFFESLTTLAQSETSSLAPDKESAKPGNAIIRKSILD